jgi:hypothetical protein
MKRPLGIYIVSLAVLASLAGAISCWTEIVPRLISGPGPRTWIEWLAVVVLSALPFSVPPAVIAVWWRIRWAPAAVFVWGVLWIGEMILTVVAAGALAGLRGPEWVFPWMAVLFAVYALARLVGYVGRAVSAAAAPDRASST